MTNNRKNIDEVVRKRCIDAINRTLEPKEVDGVTTVIRTPNLAQKLGMNTDKLYQFRRNKVQRKLFLNDVYSIASVTGVKLSELLEGFLDD